MAVTVGSYLRYGMLSSYICSTLVSVNCVCNERYSHKATDSVRKGFDILPHSFLLSSKLRYALPWQCISRDRPAFGQITLHTYMYKLSLEKELHKNHMLLFTWPRACWLPNVRNHPGGISVQKEDEYEELTYHSYFIVCMIKIERKMCV